MEGNWFFGSGGFTYKSRLFVLYWKYERQYICPVSQREDELVLNGRKDFSQDEEIKRLQNRFFSSLNS